MLLVADHSIYVTQCLAGTSESACPKTKNYNHLKVSWHFNPYTDSQESLDYFNWKVQAEVMISNEQAEEQEKSLFLGPCRWLVMRRRSALSLIQFLNDGGACLSWGRLQLRWSSLAVYLCGKSSIYIYSNKSLVGTASDEGLCSRFPHHIFSCQQYVRMTTLFWTKHELESMKYAYTDDIVLRIATTIESILTLRNASFLLNQFVVMFHHCTHPSSCGDQSFKMSPYKSAHSVLP
jgi:hypothetical protein